MNRSISPSIIFLIFCSALAVCPAVSGGQTQVKHHVVAPGGASAAGAIRLNDVVAQPFTGVATTAGLRHESGYLPVLRSYLMSTTTAVWIAAFDAAVTEGGVLLSWSIGRADGLTGINVYRSESAGGGFRNIAGGPIPADRGTTYEDTDVRPGQTYRYRIGAMDVDGEFLSRTVSVTTPVWRSELKQNVPNPFNPNTTISFYLSGTVSTSLRIYDTRGRLVRVLAEGAMEPGAHAIVWDGTNDDGLPVGSGVYFYRLRAGGDVFTRKMTLLK
jgi:hypothetical protein